jgi:hypothetical protein
MLCHASIRPGKISYEPQLDTPEVIKGDPFGAVVKLVERL